MTDLLAALGLALAVEGLFFAAFPDGARRAMIAAAQTPSDRMRLIGLVSAILGVLIVWGARKLGA